MDSRKRIVQRLSAGLLHGVGSYLGYYVAGVAALAVGAVVTWFVSLDPSETREMTRLDGVIITLSVATALMALFCASVLIYPKTIAIWRGVMPDGNATLDGLRQKIDAIAEIVDQYVTPRQLSDQQAKSIEEFLLKRAKHEMKVVFDVSNSEANSYAAQLYNAFRLGGWKVSLEAVEPGQKVAEGMSLKVVGPHNHGEGKTARDTIQRALDEAGVRLTGSGWQSSNDTNPPIAVLRIGHKRRR